VAHGAVHDPQLLEVLSGLPTKSLSDQVFRVMFADRDPTMGSLAGGRWAPPQEFPVLYTSFKKDCAIAEVLYHFERQPIFPSAPVIVSTLQVNTEKTLQLTAPSTLDTLALTDNLLSGLEYGPCQRIGHAAYFLGCDGIIVPSARHDAHNLVLFMDRIPSDPEVVMTAAVDWGTLRTKRSSSARRIP